MDQPVSEAARKTRERKAARLLGTLSLPETRTTHEQEASIRKSRPAGVPSPTPVGPALFAPFRCQERDRPTGAPDPAVRRLLLGGELSTMPP